MTLSRWSFALLLSIVPASANEGNNLTPQEKAEVKALQKERSRLNETIWAEEKRAQDFEKAFLVPLWNKLIQAPAGQRIPILATVPFTDLHWPQTWSRSALPHDIFEFTASSESKIITASDWEKKALAWLQDGWQIAHTDWHQGNFKTGPGHAHSTINFRIQALQSKKEQRAEFNGTIAIDWTGKEPTTDGAQPKTIRLTKGKLRLRTGKPVFEDAMHLDDKMFGRTGHLIPATVVYDFNQDGFPELLQGSVGAIFWNQGDLTFDIMPYTKAEETLLDAAVVDDFTGDGRADMLGVTSQRKLALFIGHEAKMGQSPFQDEIFVFDPPLGGIHSECTLTSGDIDGDGDQDVWLGQWKSPYHVMPKRYFDANDGHPSFLLINDGKGNFTDGTETAGLAKRRHRRSYSGSFVDLDDDGDLDLLTVNDFAGIDAYHNDGKGHFTLVSEKIIDEWHNFGMSHTLGDYNSDGRLDFYVQGMSSTTARRLDRMKAGPNDLQEHNAMRRIMGYGNRMYLASDKGTYSQPSYRDSIARTGWSWGSTSLDIDNDSHVDVFVANGHISGKSTQDHCTNFWCHEIYLPQQRSKKRSQKAIMSFLNDTLGTPDISWDGYQPNRLFLNRQGHGFTEISHLIGTGQVTDSRTAISADFNADGHMDLLFAYKNYQTDVSHLQLLHNTGTLAKGQHWIGLHLPLQAGRPITGTKVIARAGKRLFVKRLVNGDSYQSQHPDSVHFGLGTLDQVDEIRISWPDGKESILTNPAIDRYHQVK